MCERPRRRTGVGLPRPLGQTAQQVRRHRLSLSEAGSPRIAGAHAWIDCEVTHELDGGDHVIVIARVLQMDAAGDSEPLVFHKGRLGGYREPAVA